jgi:uncharacterized repeat protein (TIGR01451 family)
VRATLLAGAGVRQSKARWRAGIAAVAVGATVLGTAVSAPPSHAAGSSLGSFEIDGNLADDSAVVNGSNEPLDWATLPVVTPVTDRTNPDDIFGLGSKELEPGGWTCTTGKPPGKVDIVSGQVAFRTVGTDQFLYASFFRKDVNGDAHMDFEFNRSTQAVNSGCAGVPMRTQGDRLVAFDTENGGATIMVRVFRWDGNATTGAFNEVSTGSFADGAVNIPPSKTIPGHKNGDFGEAVINLTKTIGSVSCTDAAGVWLKTRSSTSITSELKDYTRQSPIRRSDCPSGSVLKQVRNASVAGSTFATTANAAPGNTLEYKLTYTNSGAGAATNVRFSDAIAAKQTFTGTCSDGCTNNAGTLSWGPFTVAPGASKSVTFSVTLSGPFASGTTLVKNSFVTTNDQEPSSTSGDTTTTVTATAISAVAKAVKNLTAGGDYATSVDAKPGDRIQYRLTYTNTGNAAATHVVVSDPVPSRTTFESCDPSTCSTANNTVSWDLGTQNPGANVTLTFIVRLDATGWAQGQNDLVKNTAQVCADVQGCKSSDEVTVTVKTPNVTLVKAVRNASVTNSSFATSTTATPGDTLEYRLIATNNGVAPATGVVVTDVVQARQTYLTCTGGCTLTDSKLTWPSTTLAANGGTVTYTFQVRLDATFPAGETPVKNTGQVVSSQEPTAKNSNETSTTVPAAPVLGQAKAVKNVSTGTAYGSSTDASPGDTIEYQLTFSNTGNADATGVLLTDPVPTGTAYVSCTGGCEQSGSTVTWDLGTVAPNHSVVVTFRVTVSTTGFTGGTTTPIQNIARACMGTSCVDSPPVVVNVKMPSSSLTKAVRNVTDSGTFVAATTGDPGETIEYQLVYRNAGPGIAHDVVVTDAVPNRTTYLSCTAGCTVSDGVVRWSLGDVAANGGSTLTFRVQLDSVFPSGSTLVRNVGNVVSREEPTGSSSNPADVTVTATPVLALAKSADKSDTVVMGDAITYTLVYSNSGNAAAEDTQVRETVPAGTSYQSCTGGCTVDGTSVTWAVGSVAPGTGSSVTLTVSVASTVTCTICNVATVASRSEANGAAISSNQVCLFAQPPANPAGAHANGSAMGASVVANLPLAGPIDQRLSTTSSSVTGLGQDAHDAYLDTTPIPNPLSIPPLLNAAVMRTSSASSVTASPARARDLSTAETLNVNVAGGLVTAGVVLGSAEAQANGDSSSYSSEGSTFKNLVVNGVARNDVGPNTRIAVGDVTGLGLDVSVVLREEIASATGPAATTASGGTYAANLTVNMIHVHVGDGNLVMPGKQPIDVIVSQAVAHADFPQTMVCNTRPTREVSGRAAIATVAVDPPIAAVGVGEVEIPASGGTRQFYLDSASVPDSDAVVTAQTVDSFSTGVLGSTSTDAHSFASAEDLCIRLMGATGGCTISATAVRSVASSTANATSRTSAASYAGDQTRLVELSIAGLAPLFPLNVTPPPNTEIPLPGIGTVVLNEQICDNGGTLALSCSDGTIAGHTGITVRAIHVIVTVDVPGVLTAGAEVIVAEAHSDATFK